MADLRTRSSDAEAWVTRGVSAAEAARAVLAAQCTVIETLFPLVRRPTDPWDPEHLHDLRVAIRRSRSVLRQLRPVFPRGEWREHRRYLRWLQQVTGPARDLDVLTSRWDELTADVPDEHRAALGTLTDRLGTRRAEVFADLPGALDTPSARDGLAEWSRFVSAAPGGPDHGLDRENGGRWEGRPAAREPVEQLVAPRLHRLAAQVTAPDRAESGVSDEELHELRKQGKELRYLLELFGGTVLAEADVAEGRKVLKALQTDLGRHQDGVVHRSLVMSLVAELPESTPGDEAHAEVSPDLVEPAARSVLDRLEASRAEARRRIPDRLAAVATWHRVLPG